ncbi:MAG: DNA replication/repair protein RecF [Arcanobacterium sp.]|nr:DNA replication/repair protein RecF [Arcanobacterium sp.]MDY5588742.1 DNA replication/repair protein RecF [Arcanobacterium sp.]
MYISDFSLNDFRSYSQVVLHFEPGVITLVGANGQGKTNLVEGIEYLSTFNSHRVAADAALVRQGADAAVVRARVNDENHSSLLELEILAGRANRARLNRGSVRPAEILGMVRTVVFAPEDLALVAGDPGTRRRFLDNLMVQKFPRMRAVKADYEKVLRQRAALLKNIGKMRRRRAPYDLTALDIWDQQLVELGTQIIHVRAEIIEQLSAPVERYYREVSADKHVLAHIEYQANIAHTGGWLGDKNTVREAFIAALSEKREREIEAGINLVGPHRDDMQLSLGSLPAKGYASHGESWSYALALKLACWDLLRSGEWGSWNEHSEPILILDDVFAELDFHRRERLVSLIESAEQVFVTAAVGDDLPESLKGTQYIVKTGTVTPVAELSVTGRSTEVADTGTADVSETPSSAVNSDHSASVRAAEATQQPMCQPIQLMQPTSLAGEHDE